MGFQAAAGLSATETRLCQACARDLGYLDPSVFSAHSLFDALYAELGFGRGFLPVRLSAPHDVSAPRAATAAPPVRQPALPVDDEILRRRELNVLREKMLAAVGAENYETAASLRDEITKLEGGLQNA
ncbi:MAG: UvrB/UvrC motif-containing protein [Oscillospiraceae bacterium]|nr:UvrB/UvrC motif-containing protein [Oscillospiraceae bacterium]